MNAEQLKNELTTKRSQLQTRLEAIKADFRNGRAADFSEQATENENHDVLQQLKGDCEYELRLIAEALDKIEAGEYGYCNSCGESISTARLEALPYANECIKCAN
ncbi:TraR/DksA family transcriptional regulator [Flocculibacter collagenilyticus]|uniref:TraR/DksA family transcriptional regulator n=1 Tax=Flocculibacter collagenilyticus TaxID=2744479 RepID=UPI00227752F1|nr:TraR/DksA family transcriptional regulator [Flocculibacter collagenilyticus]